MPIAAVTQAFSQYAQQTTGASSSSASSSTASAAAARQEANETLATTKQEAAKGDRQARVKLARVDQNQRQNAPAPSEPGKGLQIDQKA